jgi:hypothetical protein
MNDEEKKYFEGISNSIGTTFVEENGAPEDVIKEIKEIETKTVAIQESIDKNVVLINDQSYIDFELKDLISRTNNTLEKLEADVKIGSAPRMYEVFATVVNTKRELLKELILFNKMILDMSMFAPESEEDKKDKDDMSLNVTSSDMLKFFKSMKKEADGNQIEADFTVEDAK